MMDDTRSLRPTFLDDSGEVGALMRGMDWSQTSLGLPESWSPVLRSLTALLLASKQPMFVAWGPELTFLYNDAYAPIMGDKHPARFGLPFAKVWSDIWEQFGPIVEATLAGEAQVFEDLPIPMTRNGVLETPFFSFSYTPLRDKDGRAAGLFCAATETTAKVLVERRLSFRADLDADLRSLVDPGAIMRTAAETLGRHLGADRAGYAEIADDNATFVVERDWSQGGMASFVGRHRLDDFGPELIAAFREGRTLALEDILTEPLTAGEDVADAFAAITIRAAITVPLVKEGRFAAALYVHAREPRRWSEEDEALVREVAERTWSTVERARADAALRAERDVSQAARAQAEAASAEQSAILSQLAEGVIVTDAAGAITFVNEAASRIHGVADLQVPPDAYTARYNLFTEAGEPYPSTELPLARAVLRDEVVTDARWAIVRPDGTRVLAVGSARPLRGLDSAKLGAVLTLRDETARATAEDALRKLNDTLEARVAAALAERNLLATIVETTDAFIQVADLEYRLLAINKASAFEFERIFGVRPEVGDSLLDLLSHHPEQQAAVRALWGRALAGEEFTVVEAFGDPGLDRPSYEIKFNTLRDERGERIGAYQFVYDVTERLRDQDRLRLAEEQLRQSQKMEAVGQLTGGIAHDFNNLLQGITGSLDLVQKRIAQGRTGELDRFISGAVTSANRAAALTHRLLAFSRRQPLDPKPVSANPLLASMEDLLRRTLGETMELELVLAGGLWLTLCDANQLESAVLNLAINARDAMPSGGKLTIETGNAHLDTAYAARASDVRPGQYVCVSVTDTGTGMAPEVMERAFDPFFTTKPIGEGTGLGLSMIYGFARQSEGYAKIYSEFGQGTTVKLYLPRYRGATVEEPAPALVDVPEAEHGEVVVVVEDEPVVRGLIVETLNDLGYRAVEAYDGPSGLALLDATPRVDLLITDIGLPGLNGRQVADAARVRHPKLKVLFITGYAENAAVAGGFLEPGMSMLTKPFAMETLATRIRKIIEDE